MTIDLTPQERDDLTLALRQWAYDLEESTKSGTLNRTRKAKREQIERLADRLGMAEYPEIVATMPR